MKGTWMNKILRYCGVSCGVFLCYKVVGSELG